VIIIHSAKPIFADSSVEICLTKAAGTGKEHKNNALLSSGEKDAGSRASPCIKTAV